MLLPEASRGQWTGNKSAAGRGVERWLVFGDSGYGRGGVKL